MLLYPRTPSFFPYTTLFRSLIKNACLKLYNLGHTATNSPLKPAGPDNSDDLLFKKLFSPSKLMTIIGDEIPLISEKQSRSEEHTSELQSRFDLVCRLLLEKK